MEIGVFSKTYETGNIDEAFRRMSAQGITCTQLNLSSAGLPTRPESIDEHVVGAILRAARRYNIRLSALSGTFNMINPDDEIRRKCVAQFAIQCRIAAALNIPVITLCSGSRNSLSKWMWHEENASRRAWDTLIKSTEEILKYARDSRIVLGVEPETNNIIRTSELARKYLDEFGSPRLKIVMDAANLLYPNGENDMRVVMRNAFDLLGGDIVLAHAKDVVFGEKTSFAPAGQGSLDFPYYISLLRRSGYNGPIIMHGLSESQVPESRAFCQAAASLAEIRNAHNNPNRHSVCSP